MKFNISVVLFRVIAVIAVVVMLTSCEKEVFSPAGESNPSGVISENEFNKGNGKGKGKNNQNDPPIDPPEVDPFVITYQLYQADDSDPLFRFSISQSGELMLLESDATVASWGTDFWGYWSDPFPYANNEVHYIIGLTNTTYQFQPLPDNKIDVTKILIVQPYPSGTPTTTLSHPGVYGLVN
jgi:hypothetical protein